MKRISLKNVLIFRIIALTLLFGIFSLIFYTIITNLMNSIAQQFLISMGKNIKTTIESVVNSEQIGFQALSEKLVSKKDVDDFKNDIKKYNYSLFQYRNNKEIFSPLNSNASKSLPEDLLKLLSQNKLVTYYYIKNNSLIINRYLLLDNNDLIYQFVKKINLDIKHPFINMQINYSTKILYDEYNKSIKSSEVITRKNSQIELNIPEAGLKIYLSLSSFLPITNAKISSIIILIILLYLIWLISEIFFIRFTTKPLFDIFANFKRIQAGSRDLRFGNFSIYEYDIIAKAAEETLNELHQEEIKVNTILSRLPIPVAVFDKSFNINYRNKNFDKLFELDNDKNYNLLDLVPESMKILEEHIDKFVNSLKQKYRFELYDPKYDAYYIVRLGKILDNQNKLIGYLITFNDISNQKKDNLIQEERANKLQKIVMNIEEAVIHLNNSSSELEASASTLSSMLSQQNTSISETNTSIMELNTFTEQILSSLNNITNKSDAINEETKKTEEKITESNEGMKELTNKINKVFEITNNLNQKTNEIRKILKTIYEISEHTNILSLNASIEAVREDSNKESFKIIAEEIRELSEKTYKFTSDIENKIETISSFSTSSVMIVEETIKNIEEGYEDVKSLSENFEKIFLEIQDLNSNLHEIINAIKDLKQATNDISNTSNEMLAAMNDALKSANETLQTAQDIKAVAKTLRETIDVINKLKS
ncbi:methyl-accepting chemotaxis protein [Deferribacter abyssi]|uniref:methyl-accepting chemotaxis protein n=1 Tax=Deferribacter abyssi TaxID=213806 RepID=UPI003C1D7866